MYPGMEETFVHGNTKNIQDRLSDDRTMKLLLETELMNYNNGDIAGGGNVLMAIGIK